MLYYRENLALDVGRRLRLRADRQDGALAAAEHREEPQELLPRQVLLVEQLHSPLGIFPGHDFGSGFHPFAAQPAARIAGRDSYTRIVADAFYFASIAVGVDVEFRGAGI